MKNLVQLVETALGNGDRDWWFPAEGRVISLSVLWSRAAGMAGRLSHDYGVRPGDRVLVVLENGSDYVSLLLAIWCLSAVAVPIRPYGGRHFWFDAYLAELARIADYRLIVHEPGTSAFDTAAAGARLGRPCITVGALRSGSATPVGPAADSRPEDHAVIQFTSGSTGQPKGVIVTHGMMLEQLEQLRENHRYARRRPGVERALSWLPFFHDMGLFIGVLLPLFEHAHGGAAPTAYYMRNPARWFQHLSDWRADLSFSTSSVLAASLRLLGRLDPAACRLDALHLCVAAEKVSPRVLRSAMGALAAFGMAEDQWHIGYGMAEYALGCTHSPHGAPRTLWIDAESRRVQEGAPVPDAIELVSVGIPNSRCRIAIHAPDGSLLPEGRVGEIRITGPCLTPGYLNDPVASRLRLAGGWLHTGDLGLILQGELYFLERLDDLMVIGGRNVVPSDIELLVEDLPEVGPGRSVLFAVENPETGGAEPVLLVEAADSLDGDGLNVRESRIRERVVEEAGLVIKRVVFVPRGSIEKTSSGKKRRRIVRQRYLNGELGRMEAHAC
jgi:acyl-CoA synthetase (AMP-forming)/AMP-acid ligase II